MTDKYTLDGHTPIPCEDFLAWGRWFETADEARRVALTTVGEACVSTVFLGIDHNWLHGELALFETLIFGGDHDGWIDRYGTWDEAEAGHAAVCAWLRGEAEEEG